jgi:cytochrome bd-type quinol oxidase subunit 1
MDVALSLAFYIVVYLIMFPTGIAFMAGLVRRGPQPHATSDRVESGLPSGPFENAARTASDS